MTNTRVALAFVSVSLLTFASGCAASPDDVEPAEAPRAAGLTITEQRDDVVRGSLERGARRIAFDFRAEGDVHRSKVWDESGTLVESTLTKDFEDTTYLGGKARVHGQIADEKPIIEGDAKIFETLNAHPTAPLYFELQTALAESGVPRTLFSAPMKEAGVAPKYLDRGQLVLDQAQSTTIATSWAAWIYTDLMLYAYRDWSSGCVQAQTGWSPWVCSGVVRMNGPVYRTGARYYGYNVRIANNAISMAGQDVRLGVWIREY